ncbi:NAD-P-binding protein [Mycena alexandri]|uniref:NAD-P-binding protein n=1 Tax=Mycena alexandri TaxID=1745969 RepID=A0AAD6S757_9AGAR|nr:NAD-P-binding protein [Mycena alexandri]
MSFTSTTTAQEVATVLADQIRGKNVLITGTSINGIGFETARVLAKYANLVIITGYNSERLTLSKEAIEKEVPGANIRSLVLDLSSRVAVRKAAAEVNAYPEPIHVLINNAAAAVGKFKLTVDGLENQIATDHINPFLFTKLLTPKLLAALTSTYTPRVVFVSSGGHALVPGGVNLTTLAHPDPEKYAPYPTYWEAKSANILTAIELSKRADGKINAYSLNPGPSLQVIFTNGFQKEDSKAELIAMGLILPDGSPNKEGLPWKTIPKGAATTVVAAFDPKLDDKSGSYLNDCVEANDQIAPSSSDPETAAKLWEITEGIIGEAFVF